MLVVFKKRKGELPSSCAVYSPISLYGSSMKDIYGRDNPQKMSCKVLCWSSTATALASTIVAKEKMNGIKTSVCENTI